MDSFHPRSWNGRANQKSEPEDNGLLVFGYACNLYPNDEQAEFVSEERHLQPWNGDGSLRIDRYDCRLLLSSIDDRPPRRNDDACPTEQMEEEMCDEERYKDLYTDIQKTAVEEEEKKRQRAEVAFDYGTPSVSSPGPAIIKEESDSDSEDEPFQPPIGVKLPMGLALPENQKHNHIIERTAVFVVSKGPQMEIVIKAKQRNNAEQFGFLEFDNVLYPYYKYISKLIREKKYMPDLSKKRKKENVIKKEIKNEVVEPGTEQGQSQQESRKTSNALAAIAQQNYSSDDSDSDCELHPSLFARKRTPSPDIMAGVRNASGPRQKPPSPSPEKVSHIRKDYDMSKSNDMYASLFKNLAHVSNETEKEKQRVELMKQIEKEMSSQPADEEWRSWWKLFYGSECLYKGPRPMVPPPPDLEPVVASYAAFVARHGAHAEEGLRARPDLQLHFMHMTSPHFSYYQHRVRYIQWEIESQNQPVPPPAQQTDFIPTEETNSQLIGPTLNIAEEPLTSAACAAPASPSIQPEVLLNRKARRRLTDGVKAPAPPPGVFDPVAAQRAPPPPPSPPTIVDPSQPELHKTHSAPAFLASAIAQINAEHNASPKPFMPLGPVSFQLTAMKEEPKMQRGVQLSADESDDTPLDDSLYDNAMQGISDGASTSIGVPLFSMPPIPPTMPNNAQIDRKEKARVFMAKLLNDKQKKLKEAEDLRIRELEKQKLEIERQLLEAEYNKKMEAKRKAETPAKAIDLIDHMINSRLDNVFKSNGLAVEPKVIEKKEKDESKVKKEMDSDEEDSKKKKDKKKKHHKHKSERKRSRSRSRSKDRNRDSGRRDKRRRSRSPDRSSDRRRVR